MNRILEHSRMAIHGGSTVFNIPLDGYSICYAMYLIHDLAWANFRNVIMLTHICKILIEILNTVTVRFIRYLCQLMRVNLLSLFHVASLGWGEIIIPMSGTPILDGFVSISRLFLVQIS